MPSPGEREWAAQVSLGAAGAADDRVVRLELARQAHRDEMVPGTPVTIVSVGRSPVWVRLPSGAELRTDRHPGPRSLQFALMAVALVGVGGFVIDTGLRSRTATSGWWGPAAPRIRAGVLAVPVFAAVLGAAAQIAGGATLWVGPVAAAVGAGLGVLVWRLQRRRAG